MKNWEIIGLILIVLLAVVAVSGCIGDDSDSDSSTLISDDINIVEDGTYDSKEEVAAYISQYHKLPSNTLQKERQRLLDGMAEALKNMLLENALEGIYLQTDNQYCL